MSEPIFTKDELIAAIKAAFMVGVLAGGALAWLLNFTQKLINEYLAEKRRKLEERLQESLREKT